MKGKVVQFRRGRQKVTPRHFILQVEALNTRKEAEKLIGKHVEWKSPAGRIIKGYISAAHGKKGLVRAVFEKVAKDL